MNAPDESNDARLSSPRVQMARLALQGLSIGDAFGQQFFSSAVWHQFFQGKQLPLPVWRYTDDTVMALSVLETLERHERIDQDHLIRLFLERFTAEPNRGYGAGLARLMRELGHGGDWRVLSRASFDGAGSFGNGAAMRVAPVGAFFSENWDDVVEQGRLSAEVTHAHPDGIAGAIAVAVAAAWAWRWQRDGQTQPRTGLLETAARLTPEGAIRGGILRALEIPLDSWEHTAANALGNGEQITAADTVPFCLWCAAAHLDDFCEGLLAAVRVRGDIDTNCAIVGGILALAVSETGLPEEWLRRRESLVTLRRPK